MEVRINNDIIILGISPTIKLTLTPESARVLGDDLMRAAIKINAEKNLKKWIEKQRRKHLHEMN